jgi:Fe-S-cluster containining protein
MTGRYLPLLQQLDRWQDTIKHRHPGVVPCRPSCAACCHGPFDISVADAATLIDGVSLLAAEVRRGIIDRAEAQVSRMVALEPGWSPPYDIAAIGDRRFDAISDALADEPCPLLDEAGRCLAYAHRPMVCRLMGLGLVAESGEAIENGCPIQAQFPTYQALPPQRFDLGAWESFEDLEKSGAAQRLFGDPSQVGYETTVAGAILRSGGNWQ